MRGAIEDRLMRKTQHPSARFTHVRMATLAPVASSISTRRPPSWSGVFREYLAYLRQEVLDGDLIELITRRQ
jgi:hypothetical protein